MDQYSKVNSEMGKGGDMENLNILKVHIIKVNSYVTSLRMEKEQLNMLMDPYSKVKS